VTVNKYFLQTDKMEHAQTFSNYTAIHNRQKFVEFKSLARLKRLFFGVLPQRPIFDPKLVHVGFLTKEVTPEQISLRNFRVSPVTVTSAIFSNNSIYHRI
jgi:hypothetical protein